MHAGLSQEQVLFECRKETAQKAAEQGCDSLAGDPPLPPFRKARMNINKFVQKMPNYDNTSAADSWVPSLDMAVEGGSNIVSHELLGGGAKSVPHRAPCFVYPTCSKFSLLCMLSRAPGQRHFVQLAPSLTSADPLSMHACMKHCAHLLAVVQACKRCLRLSPSSTHCSSPRRIHRRAPRCWRTSAPTWVCSHSRRRCRDMTCMHSDHAAQRAGAAPDAVLEPLPSQPPHCAPPASGDLCIAHI